MRRRGLLNSIEAWRAQVEILHGEVNGDATVPWYQAWGPDDLAILMLTRQWLEARLAKSGTSESRADAAAIDGRYRELTADDTDGLMTGYLEHHEDLPRPLPWWCLRIPRTGPLVEELRIEVLGARSELMTRAYFALISAAGESTTLTDDLNSPRRHDRAWASFTTRVDEGAEVGSGFAPTAPMQHHVDALLSRVLDDYPWAPGDATAQLTSLVTDGGALVIVQEFDHRHLGGVEFVLSASWLTLLAAHGCVIDIDQYVMDDDNEEDDDDAGWGTGSDDDTLTRTRLDLTLVTTWADGRVLTLGSGLGSDQPEDKALDSLLAALGDHDLSAADSIELVVAQDFEFSWVTETGLHFSAPAVAALAGLGASIRFRHDFHELPASI